MIDVSSRVRSEDIRAELGVKGIAIRRQRNWNGTDMSKGCLTMDSHRPLNWKPTTSRLPGRP